MDLARRVNWADDDGGLRSNYSGDMKHEDSWPPVSLVPEDRIKLQVTQEGVARPVTNPDRGVHRPCGNRRGPVVPLRPMGDSSFRMQGFSGFGAAVVPCFGLLL